MLDRYMSKTVKQKHILNHHHFHMILQIHMILIDPYLVMV